MVKNKASNKKKRVVSPKPASSKDAKKGVYERFSVDQLVLDPRNPRLVEFTVGAHPKDFDLLKALYQQMAVEEVAMSIAYNGYFEHEPLIIEARKDGKYTVIEGNRRLAAVKLLLSADLRKKLKATDLPKIDEIDRGRRKEIARLPAVVSTRKDMWRYLGFKHVNGPATWGAYAKAQYIAEVHNDYGVSLTDIALQIGDYSKVVERQYRGLMVIQQAENEQVFDRKRIYKKQFYFNYIYTALDNANFRRFLGIGSKQRTQRQPVPKSKIKALGDLCLWLYGNKDKGVSSIIRSQNPDLGILGDTLADSKGVKALRDGLPLRVAHDISKGDMHLFRAALRNAREALQRAHATLTTGYDKNDRELMQQAIDVESLARDLVDEMETKQRKGKRTVRKKRGV